MLFRFSFIIFLLTLVAVSAQDYGPVKIDLEEYVDDSKLEIHEDKSAVKKDPKTEIKKDPKTEVKKDPATGRGKRPRPPRNTTSTTPRKSTGKVQLPTSYKKDSGMMMYIIIAAAALVVIGIVAVIVMKKKKPKRKERNIVLEEDVDDVDKALGEVAASKPDRPTGSSVTTAEGIKTSYDVEEKFHEETRIDDRGRNPSGIIIDEDMYFSQNTGAGSFVDEDLEGGVGPDVSDLG